MSDAAEYFRAVGHAIADRVGSQPEPTESFAEIATRVLEQVSPPRMDVLTMADWASRHQPLPKQVNFHSGFGQPPLVVFEAPGFYLEVLFWFPGRTGIHGHGFTGAFRVLDGYSIQVEYRFEEESAPEDGVRFGVIQTEKVEMIAPGKISTILARDNFIHAVAHMGNPSLTLVARTYGRDDLDQFTFFKCGFAYPSRYRQRDISRHVEVLEALHRARPAAFASQLLAFLRRADHATFFRVLERLVGGLGLRESHRELLPLVRAEFEGSRRRALAALDESIRSLGLWGIITALKDPRKQLLLVLAELFPTDAERDAIIQKSYGLGSAGPVLEQWLEIASRTMATTPQGR